MNIRKIIGALKDTRVYPGKNATNEYLTWLENVKESPSPARTKLLDEQVASSLRRSLDERNPLAFAVALSMAQSPMDFSKLWSLLDVAYGPDKDGDNQILVWPVCVTLGAESKVVLERDVPTDELDFLMVSEIMGERVAGSSKKDEEPSMRPIAGGQGREIVDGEAIRVPDANELAELEGRIEWAPRLIGIHEFDKLAPDLWYHLKKGGPDALANFCANIPEGDFEIGQGASCQLYFLVSVRKWAEVKDNPSIPFEKISMRLMDLWLKRWEKKDLVVFPIPLAPELPARAFDSGVRCLKEVSMQIATSNAVRTIRLKNSQVGVSIAAKEGGKLNFTYYEMDANGSFPVTYDVELGPSDHLGSVVQNFIDLCVDCKINDIYIVGEVLKEREFIKSWEAATKREGFFFYDES